MKHLGASRLILHSLLRQPRPLCRIPTCNSGTEYDYSKPQLHRGLSERDYLEIRSWPVLSDKRGWAYRDQGVEPEFHSGKVEMRAVYFLSTFLWMWVTYNMYYHYDMIIGEFDVPNPLEFTDKELGIPPDDFPGTGRVPQPPHN